MAKIEINLRKPCGWQYDQIRNLLNELSKLKTALESDEVNVILPEKNQVSEVALSIIWTVLNESRTFLGKKKTLYYSKTSAPYFDERHFFDNLVGKSSGLWSDRIPFHFETFTLKGNEDATASKIAAASESSIAGTPCGSEAKIHILELVSNAFNHSKTESAVGCISKFDPETGLFNFSIADRGRGVRKSFSENRSIWQQYEKLRQSELLEKATNKFITCNPKEAPQYTHSNSGIGLYFLREFCAHHRGHLLVISGGGYFYVDGYRMKMRELSVPWDGTIVSFRAALSDEINKDYDIIRSEYTSERLGESYTFK